MIQHLAHPEIDKSEWDDRLARCTNALWYARSWVLDLMSPGWEALLDGTTGSIMPLTIRKRLGVRYLYQPFGSQQLGIFSPSAIHGAEIEAFLNALPASIRYVDIHMNAGVPIRASGTWRTEILPDHVLDLSPDHETLRAAYSKGHLRNLKGAVPPITGQVDPTMFIDLFLRTTARKYGPFDRHGLRVLPEIVATAVERGEARISGIIEDGSLVAAACFVEWRDRSIFFRSAVSARGQELKAMFHIIDHYVRERSGTRTVLDMAGSSDPNIARFNTGFGARDVPYFRLLADRLPPLVRWLKGKKA